MRENSGGTDSGTALDRRTLLKGVGGATVGAAGLTGLASPASAHGKGISWIAFCNCEPEEGDGSEPEDWIWGVCVEDGEIVSISYDAGGDGCRVFFMSGGTIYEPDLDGIAQQDNATPTDAHPSASSDPCACVPTGGLPGGGPDDSPGGGPDDDPGGGPDDDPGGGPGKGPGGGPDGCDGGGALEGYKFDVRNSWKDEFIDAC